MTETTAQAEPSEREVSRLLCAGIIMMPFIFAWFLLREGYSILARIVGLGWMVFVTIAFVLPALSTVSGGSNISSGLVTVALMLAAVVGVGMSIERESRNRHLIRQNQLREFVVAHQGWDIYISPYNDGVLGLNQDGGEVVLGVVAASKQYRLADVASVEILKDGASITTTNRGSQLLGAAVGDLLLGRAGLLLGGLSGSKRTRATIHSVAMKVIVDDRAAPVHLIEFFQSPDKDGTDAKSPRIKPSLAKADHFHALMVTAMRRVANATLAQSAAPVLLPATTTDQLSKLWELRQAGALTDEEFESQKAQLINASKPQAVADQS